MRLVYAVMALINAVFFGINAGSSNYGMAAMSASSALLCLWGMALTPRRGGGKK